MSTAVADDERARGAGHAAGSRPAGIAEQLNLQDRNSQAEPCQLRQLEALARRYDLRIEDGQ